MIWRLENPHPMLKKIGLALLLMLISSATLQAAELPLLDAPAQPLVHAVPSMKMVEQAADHTHAEGIHCQGKDLCPLDAMLAAEGEVPSPQGMPQTGHLQGEHVDPVEAHPFKAKADDKTWAKRKRRPYPKYRTVPQPLKVGKRWSAKRMQSAKAALGKGYKAPPKMKRVKREPTEPTSATRVAKAAAKKAVKKTVPARAIAARPERAAKAQPQVAAQPAAKRKMVDSPSLKRTSPPAESAAKGTQRLAALKPAPVIPAAEPPPAPIAPTSAIPEDPNHAMELLVRAQKALEKRKLSRPLGDNALFYTNRVLDLYSWHPTSRIHAYTMLRRIHRYYMKLAEEALAKKQKKRSARLVGKVRAIFDKYDLRDPSGEVGQHVALLERRLVKLKKK
uniref:Uncharacterized protein n=1 Tax=Magnetococcus massalia (strain MO-1) TaxID=451514 RepID=A0A1S7LMM5_MAGMO|nr:Exported protein of unknown function [Candidatus Magnetococcus massalia]